jgi:hypothetical protein
MSSLSNRTNLKPRPAPVLPPWRYLPSRAIEYWLNVSAQSLINWRSRGTGPSCFKDRSGRVWYRVCDVQAWSNPTQIAPDLVRDYLKSHQDCWSTISNRRLLESLGALTAPDRMRLSYLASSKADDLNEAELYELCELADRAGWFARSDKPFGPLSPCHVPQTRFESYFAPGELKSATA